MTRTIALHLSTGQKMMSESATKLLAVAARFINNEKGRMTIESAESSTQTGHRWGFSGKYFPFIGGDWCGS